MKIGKPVDPIVFKSTLKLNVEKKTITTDENGRLIPTPLAKAMSIAGKHKLGVFIGEDVFICNADSKLETDLKNNSIPYTIIEGDKNGKT